MVLGGWRARRRQKQRRARRRETGERRQPGLRRQKRNRCSGSRHSLSARWPSDLFLENRPALIKPPVLRPRGIEILSRGAKCAALQTGSPQVISDPPLPTTRARGADCAAPAYGGGSRPPQDGFRVVAANWQQETQNPWVRAASRSITLLHCRRAVRNAAESPE